MADVAEVTGETQEKGEAVQEPKQELTMDVVKKMIQSETDRVRTEYSRKLKETEAEKEELLKKSMSDKERAQFEIDQREKMIQETESALAARELALERANVITEMQIPSAIAPFVNGANREEIVANAQKLMSAFDTAVRTEATRKLVGDSSGAKPESGTEPAASDMSAWKRAWSMKAGAEKEAELSRLFGTLKGQEIPIASGG